ncbi:hypothetical protein LINPERPRIM_LOCUS16752 [Linum perenne]
MSRGIAYSSSSSTLLRCCNSSDSFKSSQSRKEPLLQCATSISRRSILRICFEGRKKRSAFFTMAATGGAGGGVPHGPLDLTEENVRQVLLEARQEAILNALLLLFDVQLGQLFDGAVGITGEVELADLDGPYVKISLKGRFWHKRSTVVARLGNYLQQRIPEILEVEIEDEKQLDDSPASF